MKVRLTDIAVRRLASPNRGQVTYWDEATPGFGVRCSSKSKSFVVMFGEKRRLKTLGRYPSLSLSDARKEARQFLAQVLDGPMVADIPVITFGVARDEFLRDCAARNKPRTVADYTRLLNRHFKFKADIRSLSRQQIMKIVSSLSGTPYEQAHAYVAIRTMMNWCVRHGYIDRSAVPSMSYRTKSRNRILTEVELKAVYRHSTNHPYPYGPIVQLAILTGQRRGEIVAMRRSWIADDTMVFPEGFTKNKHEHRLPLPPTALSLIGRLPNSGDLLFPARNNIEKTFNGWGKCKSRFDDGLELAPYTLHDLRRTFSSNMAMLGVPIQVTEKILNHISGTVSGVAAVYNRYSYFDEMLAALRQHNDYLENLINS
jgi:integrase